MSRAMRFVLAWSALCFIATVAAFRPNLVSLAALLAEAWLVDVGVDMCMSDE